MSRTRAKSSASRHRRAAKNDQTEPSTKSLRLGRQALAKISEVEGIRLSDEAQRAFAEFDAKGLSPEERRQDIIRRFKNASR